MGRRLILDAGVVIRVQRDRLYDERTASAHAALLDFVQRSGQPRGALDLILAAAAVESGRTIVTTDARARFDDLPGVASILV